MGLLSCMAKEVEQQPFDIQAAANAVAWKAWFLSELEITDTDQTIFIPAELSNRKLMAVIVQKGKEQLTYNQHLKGLLENQTRETFSIIFEDNRGNPAHATFSSRRWEAFLGWLKLAPNIP